MEFLLKKPVDIDGSLTEKIDYSFKKLKGQDLLDIFNELRDSKHVLVGAYETDPVVASALFAKASGLDITDIGLLKGIDYVNASAIARNFFKEGYEDISLDSKVLNLSSIVNVDSDDKNAIEFDFDELTGQDIISTVDELRKFKYIITGSYEADPILCAALFAKASKIKIKDVLDLSAKDFLRSSNICRLFFIQSLNGGQASEILEK